MKSKSFRMLLCAVLVFAMMALAACGSKSGDSAAKTDGQAESGQDETDPGTTNDDANADAPEDADTQDDSSSDSEGGTTSDGKFASIADYVNSPEFQSELEKQMSQFEGQGLTMEVTGEGDSLVYTYTYEELEVTDGMAEQLEAALEPQKDTFVQVAKSLKLVVDVENPVVVVKYMAPDGSEIYSAEFSAE